MKGNKKCNPKNRVRVGFLTANPPHTQTTSLDPKIGIADKRFVITVAAQ
jgi:hypothetical protein